MRRQDDPRPAEQETLCEYIDRVLLQRPAGRLWHVWGWPQPPQDVICPWWGGRRLPTFIETSRVESAAWHPSVNMRIIG